MTPEQLKEYKKRRQAIVRMHDRKNDPMTFEQIAVHFSISIQRAHQLYHYEKASQKG